MLGMTYFFPTPFSYFLLQKLSFYLFYFPTLARVLVAGFFSSPVQQFQTSYVIFCFWGSFVRETGRIRGVFYVFYVQFCPSVYHSSR